MFGHRYFGSAYFGPRYFGDGGAGAPPVVVTPDVARKRPGPAPGSYPPKRFYLPPREKVSVTQAKKIYQAARAEVPETKQRDLIPAEVRSVGTSTEKLPQPQFIDFDKLRSDLGTLRKLIAAVEVAEQRKAEERAADLKRQKRQRDEEALIRFLMTID